MISIELSTMPVKRRSATISPAGPSRLRRIVAALSGRFPNVGVQMRTLPNRAFAANDWPSVCPF